MLTAEGGGGEAMAHVETKERRLERWKFGTRWMTGQLSWRHLQWVKGVTAGKKTLIPFM